MIGIGFISLLECMGGGIVSAIKAVKIAATTVNIADKSINAAKKYNAKNKGKYKGGKI